MASSGYGARAVARSGRDSPPKFMAYPPRRRAPYSNDAIDQCFVREEINHGCIGAN